MYKLLTTNDIGLIDSLVGPGDQRIGMSRTKIPRQDYIDYVAQSITLPNHELYMWYDGDEPVSMICFYNFSMIKEYAVLNQKVFRKLNYFDGTKNGFMNIAELIKQKEDEHRYSFIFLRSVGHTRLNNGRVMRDMFKAGAASNFNYTFGLDFAKKYIRTVEEFVPAGETSKIDAYSKILFRGKKFEEDTVVCRFTCLQKYRTNLPPHVQEDILTYDEMQAPHLNQSE